MDALITGGAGFVGSHLSEALLNEGHRVLVLDDLSTGRLSNIEHQLDAPGFEFIQGSVMDAELVDEVVSRSDTVFHLAASVGVNLILEAPLDCYRNNVTGTERVLDAALKYDSRVLVTSTSEVYGKNTSDALGEDDDRILGSPLKSRWSYATAKAVDELYAYCYWRERGLRAVIVRLFNTVGPRQTGQYGMVIPRFVEQALRGEAISVYGDGRQTRCFAYVGDVVPALIRLVELDQAYGKVFNLGSPHEISIADLADLVAETVGSTAGVRYVPYELAYGEGYEDMQRRVPDIALARSVAGFEPRTPLDRIIDMVLAERQAMLDAERAPLLPLSDNGDLASHPLGDTAGRSIRLARVHAVPESR